jgi:hypothetical protein
MVAVTTSNVVGNTTFIHLKVPTRSSKIVEEEDSQYLDDVA